MTAAVFTTGVDSGDKCTGKAMSYGYKNALFQVLCIPTAAEEDNEAAAPADQPAKAAPPQIHPRWKALAETIKGLPETQKQTLISKWRAEGRFREDKNLANHPLSDADIKVMHADVDSTAFWLADKQVAPAEDVQVLTPILNRIAEVSGSKRSITARSVIDEALGEGATAPDAAWDLAEQHVDEINWKQWASKNGWKAPDLLKEAKIIAMQKGVEEPKKLDDVIGSVSDGLRILVIAKSAEEPF